jgi:hypothetical protein
MAKTLKRRNFKKNGGGLFDFFKKSPVQPVEVNQVSQVDRPVDRPPILNLAPLPPKTPLRPMILNRDRHPILKRDGGKNKSKKSKKSKKSNKSKKSKKSKK